MGKIRGTLRMRNYISVLLGTNKISTKSLIFRIVVERKKLPRDVSAGLGAGIPGSNFDAPTTYPLNDPWIFLDDYPNSLQLESRR